MDRYPKCNKICSSKYTHPTWEESFHLGASWGSNILPVSLHNYAPGQFCFQNIFHEINWFFGACNRPLIFTVVHLVAWPLNKSETAVDLVLRETLLLFLCKFQLFSMRTASLTNEMQGGFYQNKVNSSLTFIQRPGH